MRRPVPLLALALPALMVAALPLSGCGLRPLHAGGRAGPVATLLSSVAVAPIEGEAGWLVRGALRDQLRASGESDRPRYRVVVRLDDDISGFGVRSDDAVTRERRTLRARWQLVDAANGATVLDATAASESGIDVVGSEYATIAAERTALERLADDIARQIVARIAVYANRHPDDGADGQTVTR